MNTNSCVHEHIYFIHSDDGRVYVWGKNEDGELGMGEDENVPEPTLLHMERPVVCVACGYYHAAIVTGKFICYILACLPQKRG